MSPIGQIAKVVVATDIDLVENKAHQVATHQVEAEHRVAATQPCGFTPQVAGGDGKGQEVSE